MKLKFNRQPKAPRNVKRAEMEELIMFLNTVIIGNHNNLAEDFYELRDEIATNGVVRDLRKLEKAHEELKTHTANLIMEHDRQLADLGRNGVATAINKLNAEVFADKKSGKYSLFEALAGVKPSQDVTLAGKVDAIIAHLGIDVTVTPKEVIESKVEVKKKPVAKKKGRR